MKKIFILCTILLLIAPAASAIDMENFTFGGQVRMRGYELNNFFDFNDDNDFDNWNVFRSKTSVWTKVDTGHDVTGFIKFTNQHYGEGVDWYKDNKSNKVFVDNAYINANKLFDLPISLKIGRQNLMYGTGFVLFDGQSQFASTSIYFDGVKLSTHFGDNIVVDWLYFKDQEKKRWLQDFGEPGDTADDITLSGAYLTAHCPVIGGQQEIYILNRLDEGLDTEATPGNEKDIWMVGIRLSDKYDFGLDYSAEIAYQDGNFEASRDQEALGYKLDAGYTLKDIAPTPRVFLGYASLSGDDPETEENERWDVFYGGWPQFGDLLAWKYVNAPPNTIGSLSDYDPNWNEGSTVIEEAVYSNLNIAKAGIGLRILKNLSTQFSYSMLTVDEPDYIDPETNELVENDDDFGDFYQLKISYKYTENLSFAIYTAMIEPGDAFVNEDEAYEAFWETNLVF